MNTLKENYQYVVIDRQRWIVIAARWDVIQRTMTYTYMLHITTQNSHVDTITKEVVVDMKEVFEALV